MNDELREDLPGVPTEYLCPACGAPLREAHYHAHDPHIENWALWCSACGRRWDIKGDVPVLVPPNLDTGAVATVETFAYKWGYDLKAMREERARIANAWFLQRFWFSTESHLARYLEEKQTILDAGCGIGNLTTLFAALAPHATVYAVDLSTAVHSVPSAQKVRRVQADITRLPIDRSFDLIVSDGVLHHTPSTQGAMAALAKKLAPGGDLLFYTYKQKAPLRELADDRLRAHVTQLQPEQAMAVCRTIADLGRQLREAQVTVHLDAPIEALGIPAGDHDLQRLVYWHFMKCFWDDGGNEVASVLENFDWYHPMYAWRHTRAEVERWLDEAQLETVGINEVEAGFAVHARRPT